VSTRATRANPWLISSVHTSFCFHPGGAARAVLILSLLAIPLRGQTDSATDPAVQLDALRVDGRSTDLVGVASSSSQGIVGPAELGSRPFLRRGELLEVIPGVVVTQHSGDGKANQYFLRGFNLDHGTDFSLTVDGMPVNLRSHAHGQGYADLNFVIPELVRQIDYSKGPFFADVGDFSAAGAAEFRQFDALPRDFLTLTLGENRYVRFAAGATARSGAVETTAAFEAAHDDGPWELPEHSSRFNGLLREHWQTGPTEYRLTAMAYRGRWRSTDQVPARAVAAGTVGRFGTIDPTDGGESDRYSVSFAATHQGTAGTTRLTAYALHYRLNLLSNFTYFLDDPANGDQFNQRDARLVVGGGATHTWSADARQRSETTVGLQTRADLIDELGLFRTAGGRRLSTVRDDRVDELSAGVFVKNETRWTDWLRSHVGLRGDAYRFRVDSDEPLNGGTRAAGIVSPKAGLVLAAGAHTEFYANAGGGFHSNDARGTTIRVDPVDRVTPAERVTPLVRSRGVEIGARMSAIPGLMSSVSLWALDLDSELTFAGDAGATEPTGPTRRYGIELANFARVNPWLTLDADVSFTRARYRDPAPAAGTRIPNSIGAVVAAGVTAGRAQGAFGSARLRYFGAQPLTEDGTIQSPPSATVDVRIGWRGGSWEVALDVLNALDRANEDIAYAYASRLPGEPAAGIEDVHFHPAEPLTLRASFTRRF
jgi:hypothetical protein